MKNNLSITERNKIVVENMHIVRIIARQYHHAPVEQDDLIQEGNLGLIIAVEHFDPTRGIRFDSYAACWIRKYITDAIRRYGYMLTLPCHRHPDDHVYTECLDKPVRIEDGEVLTYEDILTDIGSADKAMLYMEQMDDLDARLSRLTTRERMVIENMFGLCEEPVSPAELASWWGTSCDNIRQIASRAMHKLQK